MLNEIFIKRIVIAVINPGKKTKQGCSRKTTLNYSTMNIVNKT